MIPPMLALALLAQAPPAQVNPPSRTENLKPGAYLEKGMPAPDRPWSAKDFEEATRLLSSIKADGSLPLPRLRDDPSGGVFARLIDPSGLRLAEEKSLPINQRVAEALTILNATNRALTVYLVNKDERQPFGAEVLELVLFEMRVVDRVSTLVDGFTAALTPEQRAQPARQEGMKQMRGGFALVVVGAMTMLGETRQYSAEELRGFAARFPDRLPPLWPLLPIPARAENLAKIQAFAKAHPDPEFRKSMALLVKKLDARAIPGR